MIREIWRYNQAEEMALIADCLSSCPFIAIDTEFPGCLRNTPLTSSECERYSDMKFNVDRTKLIQFGFTLFDSDCRIGGTWEVNFSGFSETEDARNEDSISFLRKNGLDFEQIREDGVCVHGFFREFIRMIRFQEQLLWITFHGSYDMAYLIKMMTRSPLPRTSEGFTDVVGKTLGRVYDMKAMASRIRGLNQRFGLEKLADELGVSRQGSAHHAGSDSLLTAQAFVRMAARCKDLCEYEGFIYGMGSRVVSKRLVPQPESMPSPYTRCFDDPPTMAFSPYGVNLVGFSTFM
ncbi:PREDICTED: putative CCR4-associated factor 1 homolog 8 [Tarenaya hassleriana]|uniref:putative CCR4-associated factor 1 homolog 8 n=1 Tax=Tarenaya hassleriana TaxID=28532 RepID=UPI00053C4A8A|nr:PREDICTED: putative CCR4-associated factor 1 homolog 8 [Tarenaya hassleriana]